MIYEPKGRAEEYSPLACNFRRGCTMGCAYCYGPDASRMSRADYARAVPKADVLERLRRDAARLSGDERQVQLCFIGDPYDRADESRLTRAAIQILHNEGLSVSILTKGGRRAADDFDLLGPGDAFGTTLTLVRAADSIDWEPGAALPMDRMATIALAHHLGIRTWVSLEPVVDVNQALALVREVHPYVDEFRCGVLNHLLALKKSAPHLHALLAGTDWRIYARQLLMTLQHYNCAWLFKDDLLQYMPDGTPQRRARAIEQSMANG